MAEAVLSALVEVIFEKTSSQVMEYGMLGGPGKEMTQLRSIFSTIQDVLEEAEDQQVTNKMVKNWLMKLKDAAYDADDLLDEFMMDTLESEASDDDKKKLKDCMNNMVCNFFSQSNPFVFRYKMKCRLKQIGERLNAIAKERSNFHLKNSNVNQTYQSSGRLESDSYLLESDVMGRVKDREEIIELLRDNSHGDVSVIPIVGIGGLGKTTLAKLAYNDDRAEKHFQQRIWVCVSEDFDVKRIMKAILGSATGTTCHLQEMEVIQRRVHELVTGKRLLLVLDDVWNDDHEKWERLKSSVRHSSEGSKILVTTRSEKVALITGTTAPYYLKGLPEDDCWSLFKQRAFKFGLPEEDSIVAIGKDMVKKCRGVPLAAKTLGSLMCFKREKREWLSVKDSEIWNLFGGENKILQVLRLSYDDLPSHLKQCFAYCSIFPKDYCIEKENLVQLWMAEGFLPSSSGRKPPEEVGNEYFNELLWRSFFENVSKDRDGNILQFRMHHLFHDLARSVAGSDCSAVEVCKQESISAATRHVSMVCKERAFVMPKSLRNARKVRSFLLLVGWQKIPRVSHSFISSFKSLRALDISSIRAKKLSKSVGELKHLRYLNLSDALIKKLPSSICGLLYLQTLILKHCDRLEMLPKDLRKLIYLRHLNIYACRSLVKLPKGIGNLSSLQTLPIFIVGRETASSIAQLQGLDLHGGLTIKNLENVANERCARAAHMKEKGNLRSLKLLWEHVDEANVRENVEVVIEGLQPSSDLKKLHIENYMGANFPRWLMNSSLSNLTELSLIRCQRCVQLPPLEKLSSLEVLSIDTMDAARYISDDCTNDGVANYVSLKHLTLKNMPSLLGWSKMEEKYLFPNVKKLTIVDCLKMTDFPDLPSVESLELNECNNQLLRTEMMSSSLSNLIISGFLELVAFPVGLLRNNMNLLSLEIKDCPKLIFLSDELQNLCSLQKLTISNCDKLESFLESGSLKSLVSLSIHGCQSLQSLPETGIQDLKSLQNLSLSNCENLTGLPETMKHLTGLQSLAISSCSKLDALPEWLGNLVSLQELELWYCENLLYLPDSMVRLTSLQFLSIWGCPHLEIGCDKKEGADWYKIQHIPYIKINGPYIQAAGV